MKIYLACLALLAYTGLCFAADMNKNTEAIIRGIINGEPIKKETPLKTDTGKAVKDDPKDPQTTPRKGGDREAPQATPPDEIMLRTAIQLYNTDLIEAALVKFRELKSKYPQSPFKDAAVVWTGKILYQQNRLPEALREFTSIGEDSGEYPSALYYIGETHYKSGNLPGSIEFLYKTFSQFPEHEKADDALLLIGNIYLRAKKGNQALEAAVKMIKYYPDRDTIDDAYYLLGKVFEKDPEFRDFEKARKIYGIFIKKAGVEKDPHFSNSPLLPRVERDLRFIEATYFRNEN